MNIIDVKKAIQIAKKYLVDISSELHPGWNMNNMLLEELLIKKYQDKPDCWYITIGYNINNVTLDDENNILEKITSEPNVRRYKTIIIDKSGNVMGMRRREVEYA